MESHSPDGLRVDGREGADAEEGEGGFLKLLELLGGLGGDLLVGLRVVDREVVQALPEVGQHGCLFWFCSHFRQG